MHKIKINKIIAFLLIVSLICTSSGMSAFANVELGEVKGQETNFFIEENEVDEESIENSENIENKITDEKNNEDEIEESIEEASLESEEDEKKDSEETVEILDENILENDTKANIATNSEMSIEDISLDLDIEEKEIEDEIYGIPSQGTIIFTLPSELVEEETARFMSASGGTISEDGTTLTMTVGVPTAGSMAGKVSVNPPSVNISCDRNRGLTFNNAWNGDGVTIKPGQQNTLDFSKKSSYSFSPDYKDERGTLTLKIKETDLDKFEFELDQGEGKKVKVESKSSLSTKYYYSYKPKIKLADDKYEVMFGSYSWQGQLAKEKQDTTITATYKIVPYKVIYKFNNSDDNQNMTLEGCSPGYLEYTQNFNDEDKAVLKKVISKPDNYFRKLVAWIDDETGEEYLPGDTITHTGVRNVYLTSKVESYEPVVVYFESEYRDEPLIQYVEKGTPIGWMSVSGPEGYEVKYWYQNDRNVPFDIENTPITTPITLRAVYGPCDYDIYYEKNGGEFVEGYEPPIKRSYIGSVTLPTAEDIKKEDCYFDGWYENSQLTGDRVTVIPNNTLYHRTYYAKWRVGYYPITLNENGGTYVNGYTKPVKRAYGYTFVLPTANDIKKEGNAFGGWYNNPSFTGVPYDEISATSEEEYVLYLKWIEGVYEYHYDLGSGGSFNNGTSKDGTRTYAQELTLASSANVVREGYTFLRWDLKDDDGNVLGTNATKIEANTGKNVNIVAVWTENEYSLSFNPNGGTYATGYTLPSNKRMYSTSVTLPSSAEISKTGFTFDGWFDNENFTGNSISVLSANTAGDKTFYAKWTENVYTVNVELNNGTLKNGASIKNTRLYSEEIILPYSTEIERRGFKFIGWKVVRNDTSEIISENATKLEANVLYGVNVTAVWEENVYNVYYYENGGKYTNGYVKKETRKYSEAVTLPTTDNISRDGATFVGWYETASFTGNAITSIPANTENDVYVYLKWLEAEYTITYHENGGTYKPGVVKITKRKYSEAVQLPSSVDFYKTGYAFGGWYENSNFTGERYEMIPANTGKSLNLYAKWVDGIYSITYYEDGGKYRDGYVKITERPYSEEVVLPTKDDLFKDYYDLDGWYETPEFRGSSIVKILANTDQDKVFYAKWKGKDYNVTFETNGGSIKSGNIKKYNYCLGVTLPTNVAPPNKNKKFVGWYLDENLTGSAVTKININTSGDKKFYAKYINVYNVDFNAGGGSGDMTSIIVDEGKNFTVPNNSFTKTGFKFVHFIDSENNVYEINDSIKPVSDITLTAVWEELKEEEKESESSDSGGSGDSGDTSDKDDDKVEETKPSDSGGGSSGGSTDSGKTDSGKTDSGKTDNGNNKKPSSGNTGSGSSSSGGSSSGGSSSGGRSAGGSSSGPNNTNANGSVNNSGPGASNVETNPSNTVDVVPNVGVNNENSVNTTTNEEVLKAIQDGSAKPGMYYAWEGTAHNWKAKDMVTNEYAKNTFVYTYYAGKLRKYFFDENGSMVVGWVNHNGFIYYMNPTDGINYGDMMTGVNIVDGALCEFLPSGEFFRTIA